jgi:hypothetical protein
MTIRMAFSNGTLRELRLRYNAAYAAYQSCVKALNEAVLSGKRPTAELLENEAKSLRELTESRANLLSALIQVTNNDLAD